MTTPAVPTPLLDLVILDCPDPVELGRFYSELLRWPVQEGADESWVFLDPAGHPFCLIR